MTVACILIVTEPRVASVRDVVLPSVLQGGFDEVLWVGDGEPKSCEFLPVPRLTGTTVDALAKRDAGTLATTADWIFYLADDHAWSAIPNDTMQALPFAGHDIIVPRRWCDNGGQRIMLNMGMNREDPNFPYCAGHGGFFRRSLIQARPWLTMPHHRNWDLFASRIQLDMGARMIADNRVSIQDLEPQHQPWR